MRAAAAGGSRLRTPVAWLRTGRRRHHLTLLAWRQGGGGRRVATLALAPNTGGSDFCSMLCLLALIFDPDNHTG